MSSEQVAQLLRFGAKATGWLIVALGATAIAVKESWELIERLEWPPWTFAATIATGLVVSVLYVSLRTRRDLPLLRRKTPR